MVDLGEETGKPVRTERLPYGRQWIDDDDIAAVLEVLQSNWLTTGPNVDVFERAVADFVGVPNAVAVSSGTAALHTAMLALGIGPGDEVIVPAMTFAATANSVVYTGAKPVITDVREDSLLLDPERVEESITPQTKGIVSVDYAGQACEYRELQDVADRHGLFLVADACHSIGGSYSGRAVGSLADLTIFSFHPVKHITTGEGGMIVTSNGDLADRMRCFRNHGITSDHRLRAEAGTWHYEMTELGFNYRITDIQCALGTSQLSKLPGWISRRQTIAARYDEAFADLAEVTPLRTRAHVSHAYHLYVLQLNLARLRVGRQEVFADLRAEGLGVNVHYIPVHLHPYYRQRYGHASGDCPVAERAYERIVSLPIFPRMSDGDVASVIMAVTKVIKRNRKLRFQK